MRLNKYKKLHQFLKRTLAVIDVASIFVVNFKYKENILLVFTVMLGK